MKNPKKGTTMEPLGIRMSASFPGLLALVRPSCSRFVAANRLGFRA